MERIQRQPIQSPLAVEYVPPELSLDDFLPKQKYKFTGGKIGEEAEQMYESLENFLDVNQEILIGQDVAQPEEYAKGFRQAIALCRLWIDSIYLEREENTNDG